MFQKIIDLFPSGTKFTLNDLLDPMIIDYLNKNDPTHLGRLGIEFKNNVNSGKIKNVDDLHSATYPHEYKKNKEKK